MRSERNGTEWEVGVDIGGTFTDWVLWHEARGVTRSGKLLTQANVASSFLEAVDAATEGIVPSQVGAVRHATTVATNALLEGNTPPVVLFTTRGFRDVLEIGRQLRHDLYNLALEKTPPLVPREARIEITERIGGHGEILVPLDEDEVARGAEEWFAKGYENFAVGFINSHVNTRHEARAVEIIRDVVPEARVTSAIEIWQQHREFERLSTCVVNAAIAAAVSVYLEEAQAGLKARGLDGAFLVMTSFGGLVPASAVALRPVQIIESGPAAGAIAAAAYATHHDIGRVIAFDMGGTSAKVALVDEGEVALARGFSVGGREHGRQGDHGYPVALPTLDIVEVGAGGGSIAEVDAGGRLLVGPKSAGAQPGPVCYGLGGTHPTVTDANLVLGRFEEHGRFEGLHLDETAAAEAIEAHIAKPLGLSVRDAADAIVKVGNAVMHTAFRTATIERGRDARGYVLVATGGGGPLHASELAAEMGIETVIVPPRASVASAVGLLNAPLRWDVQRPIFLSTAKGDSLSSAELLGHFDELKEEAVEQLHTFGVPEERVQAVSAVDVRYVGQSFDVTVPFGSTNGEQAKSGSLIADIAARFHKEHELLYSHAAPGRPIEVVNLRVAAVGSDRRSELGASQAASPAGPLPSADDGSGFWVSEGWTLSPGAIGEWILRQESISTQPRETIDVATREVVRYGLQAIAGQMAAVVELTAHSTIIREILDYATALFDKDGLLVGQSSRLPFDHHSMSTTLATIATRWKPLDEWSPGEIVLTNDPYLAGSQHLPDLQIFMPLFHKGVLVGFAGCVGHHVDVGGSVPGSYCLESTDIYGEGLRLPPVVLYRDGKPVRDVWNILEANVRFPDIVRGDLDAQVASLRVADKGVSELIERVGLDALTRAQTSLMDYSERRMRQEVKQLPDRTVQFRDALDNDGRSADPVEIQVAVTIEGDEIIVDFDGTAAQRESHINATYTMTLSSVYYVVMAIVDSTIPQNGGCFRNVRVLAPTGTVVNAIAPVPVVGRIATCHRMVDVLMGAFAQVLPTVIPAAYYGSSNTVSITGVDDGGARWIQFEILVGGWGARPGSDGPSAFSAHLQNVRNTPVEVLERTFPLRLDRYELIPDSGGAGEFRGGLGTRRAYRFLGPETRVTIQSDRVRLPPYGLNGGRPGRCASFTILRATGETAELPSTVLSAPFYQDDVLVVETQGGGGHGNPRARRRDLVERDVREGMVTPKQAIDVYGLDERSTVIGHLEGC